MFPQEPDRPAPDNHGLTVLVEPPYLGELRTPSAENCCRRDRQPRSSGARRRAQGGVAVCGGIHMSDIPESGNRCFGTRSRLPPRADRSGTLRKRSPNTCLKLRCSNSGALNVRPVRLQGGELDPCLDDHFGKALCDRLGSPSKGGPKSCASSVTTASAGGMDEPGDAPTRKAQRVHPKARRAASCCRRWLPANWDVQAVEFHDFLLLLRLALAADREYAIFDIHLDFFLHVRQFGFDDELLVVFADVHGW